MVCFDPRHPISFPYHSFCKHAMIKASYSNITVYAHEAGLYLLARMWHSI